MTFTIDINDSSIFSFFLIESKLNTLGFIFSVSVKRTAGHTKDFVTVLNGNGRCLLGTHYEVET